MLASQPERRFGTTLTDQNVFVQNGPFKAQKPALTSTNSFTSFSFTQPSNPTLSTSQPLGNAIVAPSWNTQMLPVPEGLEPMECDSMDASMDTSLEDIDEADSHDPQFVTEYIRDIMDFLKSKESLYQVPYNYLDMQKEVNAHCRDLLVRIMSNTYLQLQLLSETLFLAVNIVDRVLASGPVARKKLDLVGVGALLIASKYEETWAPPVSDFIVCSNNAFQESEITRMEKVLLNRLSFNLCSPAPVHFLRRYSKAARSDSHTHTLSKYLTELSVLSHDMVRFLPSQIAAASVLLARNMRDIHPLWNSNLRHYSGYEMQDIFECAQVLNKVVYNEQMCARHSAIYQKYESKRMISVARIPYKAL